MSAREKASQAIWQSITCSDSRTTHRRIPPIHRTARIGNERAVFSCADGEESVGERDTVMQVKGGNACLTGMGCKWLWANGKGVLFTDLSTGKGDKVVPVPDGACVGCEIAS